MTVRCGVEIEYLGAMDPFLYMIIFEVVKGSARIVSQYDFFSWPSSETIQTLYQDVRNDWLQLNALESYLRARKMEVRLSGNDTEAHLVMSSLKIFCIKGRWIFRTIKDFEFEAVWCVLLAIREFDDLRHRAKQRLAVSIDESTMAAETSGLELG